MTTEEVITELNKRFAGCYVDVFRASKWHPYRHVARLLIETFRPMTQAEYSSAYRHPWVDGMFCAVVDQGKSTCLDWWHGNCGAWRFLPCFPDANFYFSDDSAVGIWRDEAITVLRRVNNEESESSH